MKKGFVRFEVVRFGLGKIEENRTGAELTRFIRTTQEVSAFWRSRRELLTALYGKC